MCHFLRLNNTVASTHPAKLHASHSPPSLCHRFCGGEIFRLISAISCFSGSCVSGRPSLRGTDSFPLAGYALFLLLTFRTQSVYDRWWEGRKQLGAITHATRDIGRYCVSQSLCLCLLHITRTVCCLLHNTRTVCCLLHNIRTVCCLLHNPRTVCCLLHDPRTLCCLSLAHSQQGLADACMDVTATPKDVTFTCRRATTAATVPCMIQSLSAICLSLTTNRVMLMHLKMSLPHPRM